MLDKNYVKVRAEKLRAELETLPTYLREMPTSRDLEKAAKRIREKAAASLGKKK
jgi:hypothetical protein